MSKRLADNQWLDIVLPAAPQADYLIPVIVISCLIILLFIIYYRFWYRHPKQVLLRDMRHIHGHMQRIENPKTCLQHIEHAILQYFQAATLQKINTDNPAITSNLHKLRFYLYGASSPSTDEISELLTALLYQLKMENRS